MDIDLFNFKGSDEDITIEKEVTQQDDDDDDPLSGLNDQSKANLIKSLFYNIKDIELQARDKERKAMQAVIDKQRLEWESIMRSLQEEAEYWKGETTSLLGAKSSKRSIKTNSPTRKVLGNILPHSHPIASPKPGVSQVSPSRYTSRPVSTLSITQTASSNTNTNTNTTTTASPSASASTSASTSNHNATPTSRTPVSLKIELQTARKLYKRLQHKYDALVAANAEIIAKRDKEREKWRTFKSTIKAALAERPDLAIVLEKCNAEMIASQAPVDTQVTESSTSRKLFQSVAERSPKDPFSDSKVPPADAIMATASDGVILDYFKRPIALRTPERKRFIPKASHHSALSAPAPILISPPPMIHGTLSTPSLSQEPVESQLDEAHASVQDGMQTTITSKDTLNRQEEAFIAQYEQFQFNEDMADMYRIAECMSELQPYSCSRYTSENNATSTWTINGRKIKGPALGSVYDDDEHDQMRDWENSASIADTASQYGDNLLALAEEDGARDQVLPNSEGENPPPEQGLDVSSRNANSNTGLSPRQSSTSQPTLTSINQPGGLLYIYPLPKELSAQQLSGNMDTIEESLPIRRKHRSQGLFLDGPVVGQIVKISSNTTSTVDVDSDDNVNCEKADQTLTSGANARDYPQSGDNVIPPWLSQTGQEDSSDEATLPSSPMPGDNMIEPSPSADEPDREFVAKVDDDSHLPGEEAFRHDSATGICKKIEEDTSASRKAAYAVSAYADENMTRHSVRSISNEKLGPRKQSDKAFTVTTADRDSTGRAGPFLDAYIAKIENSTEIGTSIGNVNRRAVSATLRDNSASSLPKNWHNMGKKRLSLSNRATSVDRATPEPDIIAEQRNGLVKQMLRTQFLSSQGGSQQDSPLGQPHIQGKKSRLAEGNSLSLGATSRLIERDTISASKIPRTRPKRKSEMLQDPDVQADLEFVERAILAGKPVGSLKKRALADISISIEEAPRKEKRQALAPDNDDAEGGISRACVRNTVKESVLLPSRADRRDLGLQDQSSVKLERKMKSNNPVSTEKKSLYNKTSDDSSEEFTGQAFMRELHRQRKKKLQEQQLAKAAEANDVSEAEAEGERSIVPYKTTTRKKEDRKQMHGYDCDCCNGYYEYATRHLPLEERREAARQLANDTSRHRQDYLPGRSPPGYWDMAFPTTQGAQKWNDEAKVMQKEKQAREKSEANKCDGRFKHHAA